MLAVRWLNEYSLFVFFCCNGLYGSCSSVCPSEGFSYECHSVYCLVPRLHPHVIVCYVFWFMVTLSTFFCKRPLTILSRNGGSFLWFTVAIQTFRLGRIFHSAREWKAPPLFVSLLAPIFSEFTNISRQLWWGTLLSRFWYWQYSINVISWYAGRNTTICTHWDAFPRY